MKKNSFENILLNWGEKIDKLHLINFCNFYYNLL